MERMMRERLDKQVGQVYMLSMYSMSLSRPKEKGTTTKQGHGNNLEKHRGEIKKGICGSVATCELRVNERERERPNWALSLVLHITIKSKRERERERAQHPRQNHCVCFVANQKCYVFSFSL
jgi:hypothetical protein